MRTFLNPSGAQSSKRHNKSFEAACEDARASTMTLGMKVKVMTSDNGNIPPDGLPTYRLLTGLDDAAFCHRVSAALALGYKLYGSPAATFNGETVIVAQAVIWPSIEAAIAESK